MERRSLLAAVGAGALALAGCLATDDEGGDGSTSSDAEEGAGMNVRHSEIETVETDCTSDEPDDISVSVCGETVTVEGVRTAPDPCHRALLAGVAVEDGRLDVDVALEAEEGLCQQCLARVEYRVTVDLDRAEDLQAVGVDHGTGDHVRSLDADPDC